MLAESMIVINSAGGACYPLLALNLHIYDKQIIGNCLGCCLVKRIWKYT